MIKSSSLLQVILFGILMKGQDAMLCPHFSQGKAKNNHRELIINDTGDDLPLRYRSCLQSIDTRLAKYNRNIERVQTIPSLIGYANNLMSGGSQHRPSQLRRMISQWQGKDFIVVDLRMESHGFLDDNAASFWCPKNWDRLAIEDIKRLVMLEEKEFHELANKKSALVHSKEGDKLFGTRNLNFQVATTERQLVEGLDIKYVRVHIPDHRPPRDAEVEQLLDLFEEFPDHWMHFHCKAGKGRTTTVMIMRDIYNNAEKLPLEDILMRNFIFSVHSLRDMRKSKGTFKFPYAKERLEFLSRFYTFSLERNGRSWYQYLEDGKRLEDDLILGRVIGFAKQLIGSKFMGLPFNNVDNINNSEGKVNEELEKALLTL